jgi:hypothetical protein
VTSLDLISLGFAVANAVLYLGFHSTILIEYLDTIIYTLLFVQVLVAQVRGEPWTLQYAKRSVAPELWATRAFLETNRFLSICWGACFLSSAFISLWHMLGAWQVAIPALIMVGMAVLTPRLAQWYARRITTVRSSG